MAEYSSSTGGFGESRTQSTGSTNYGEGGSVKQEVKDKAQEVGRQAKDQVSQVADQAKSQLTGTLDTSKSKVTQNLGSVSSALRSTSENLRGQDQSGIAEYVERAALQVDRFTDYLDNRSINELLEDAERFARREPAMFLGGALILGIAASRFLKSSRPHDESGDQFYGSRRYRTSRAYPAMSEGTAYDTMYGREGISRQESYRSAYSGSGVSEGAVTGAGSMMGSAHTGSFKPYTSDESIERLGPRHSDAGAGVVGSDLGSGLIGTDIEHGNFPRTLPGEDSGTLGQTDDEDRV